MVCDHGTRANAYDSFMPNVIDQAGRDDQGFSMSGESQIRVAAADPGMQTERLGALTHPGAAKHSTGNHAAGASDRS
jgi:hypothetical protein